MFSIEATQVGAAAIPELASGIVWMALFSMGMFWSGSRSRVHQTSSGMGEEKASSLEQSETCAARGSLNCEAIPAA
jgi:hypothetical protein